MFNVVRNGSIPVSLADKRKYDSKDVWEELSKVFHKKCYIPHQGDEDLKFDWNNLYFSCGRCNNIKLSKYDDLIDCCDPNIDVVRAVKHLPPSTPYAKHLPIEAQYDDDKTQLTAKLLDKVFNSEHTPNKAVSASFLRKRVFDQYNLLFKELNNYYDPMALPEEKTMAVERIKLLLKPASP